MTKESPHIVVAYDGSDEAQLALAWSADTARLDGSTLQFETEFTFEERDGGTLMTMIQRGLPTDELRAEHARGVPNAFARLERRIRHHETDPEEAR